MFRSIKSGVAVLIVGGIIFGAMQPLSASAKNRAQEVVTTGASQKLALAHEDAITERVVVSGDTARLQKSHKSVKPSQTNYFDVDKYDFDMVGTSALTGI